MAEKVTLLGGTAIWSNSTQGLLKEAPMYMCDTSLAPVRNDLNLLKKPLALLK
jgi:hypothetical protein